MLGEHPRLRGLGRWVRHVERLRFESQTTRARAGVDGLTDDARARLAWSLLAAPIDWEARS